MSSDSEDEIPLAQRQALVASRARADGVHSNGVNTAVANGQAANNIVPKPVKRKATGESAAPKKRSKVAAPAKPEAPKEKRREKKGDSIDIKWDTLVHSGVLFPPEYTPHGIKMLYDGRPIDLTPEQEEVATFYAVMIETDYAKKDRFNKNFWAGFEQVLGKDHVVRDLKRCDFRPIYDWHMAEREKKKALSKEAKAEAKKIKDEAEAKFKFALVDGRKEQVGNFRVEPPGLFRGRGEHPKMGQIKRRIYPRDITINIGEGVELPEHPYPGQRWKEIRHDRTVTWLAYWKDPIATNSFKYVWLAANSTFKCDSDLAKYEKARKLKEYIDDIRVHYEADWGSRDPRARQMGAALYFIDKLALRAGHEKDEDEADTVGCCTLKVENVECCEDNMLRFDFLGKDSIRYENQVQVHPRVYQLVVSFRDRDAQGRPKAPSDQLFDTMDATDLNNKLKDLMDGLSVKVFRTYNASITLDALLAKPSDSDTVDEKKADYDRANKEVAILCNHQRSVPKGHAGQMEKLSTKMLDLQAELDELQEEYKASQKGKPGKDGKRVQDPETVHRKIARKKEQMARMELNARVKEDLKTVALGTSKINYLDPRITIAWCKNNEVPLEKVFNKSLLSKFHWAMDVEPDFRF